MFMTNCTLQGITYWEMGAVNRLKSTYTTCMRQIALDGCTTTLGSGSFRLSSLVPTFKTCTTGTPTHSANNTFGGSMYSAG